jgi:hypothetical protein
MRKAISTQQSASVASTTVAASHPKCTTQQALPLSAGPESSKGKTSAFTNPDLDELVYIQYPDGFERSGYVLKVNEGLLWLNNQPQTICELGLKEKFYNKPLEFKRAVMKMARPYLARTMRTLSVSSTSTTSLTKLTASTWTPPRTLSRTSPRGCSTVFLPYLGGALPYYSALYLLLILLFSSPVLLLYLRRSGHSATAEVLRSILLPLSPFPRVAPLPLHHLYGF